MDRTEEARLIKHQSRTESFISGAPTQRIVDLGNHGFADSFFQPDQSDLASFAFPLVCRLDVESGLVQSENLTDPADRYSFVDYSYTSSNSQTSKNHWKSFLSDVNSKAPLKGSHVLEIGSNDGYLLGEIQKSYTASVLGVDASPFMSEIANSKKIPTLNGIFGESHDLEEKIMLSYSKFDFIFANNVVNHSNSPIDFLRSVGKLLKKEGLFVFEVPYWLITVTSMRFDQIYHEHVTYLTIESAKNLLNAAGLSIVDIEIIDYHGGSLRIYARHFGSPESNNVHRLLETELSFELKEVETYEKYMLAIENQKVKLLSQIDLRRNGKTVFGVGAAAKANTFLTYYGFNSKNMAFVLDSSEYKVGKLTPVTKIPIYDDEKVLNIGPGLGVLLAWNIAIPLKTKLLDLNPEIIFLND